MKESAQAAFSYIRSHANQLGIKPDFQDNFDIHIHIPEGATPKDGPSAGVAMAVALISAMTKRPVRASLAMTGEITLRGNVLVIGGLKEKVLAALRAGIKTVIYPRTNEKDLQDIPDYVHKSLDMIPVSHLDEVLNIAFKDKTKSTRSTRSHTTTRTAARQANKRSASSPR
jgi:ATP-dependent Lon protease